MAGIVFGSAIEHTSGDEQEEIMYQIYRGTISKEEGYDKLEKMWNEAAKHNNPQLKSRLEQE